MKTINVFISHSWHHVDDLKNLRGLLLKSGIDIYFTEVPPHEAINSSNAYYVKRRISQKLDESDVVIGLCGIYASYSEWMEWELETAYAKRKPIIGVVPWGRERISQVVQRYTNTIVRWNTSSIEAAIREACR